MALSKRGGRRPGAGRHKITPGMKKVQLRFYVESRFRDALLEDEDGTEQLIQYIKRKYATKARKS